MLFWVVIIAVTLALSLFLATRSMRGFQKKLLKSPDQALFLIRNSQLIDAQLLTKLYDLSLREDFTFSFEWLIKGQESALVIFAPKRLESLLPELGLLELEDYLISREETIPGQKSNRVTADLAFGWQVPVSNGNVAKADFLSHLELKEDEQLFWQVVFKSLPALKSQPDQTDFQLTVRAMVASQDQNAKIRLAKRISELINLTSEKVQTSPALYDQFLSRLPHEGQLKGHRFSPVEALQLLNI